MEVRCRDTDLNKATKDVYVSLFKMMCKVVKHRARAVGWNRVDAEVGKWCVDSEFNRAVRKGHSDIGRQRPGIADLDVRDALNLRKKVGQATEANGSLIDPDADEPSRVFDYAYHLHLAWVV